MFRRSAGASGLLTVVQTGYLLFAIPYLARHGLPALGDGTSRPYAAYFALNCVTFPLAVVLLPLVYTVLVSRHRLTKRTARLLREVWMNTVVTMPLVALIFQAFAEGWVGQLRYRLDRPLWFLVGEGLAVLLLADLWFYATHRALHAQRFYRFHKAHHAHVAPTEPTTFLALSATELCVEGLLMVSFPLIVLPVHAPVAIVCAAIVTLCGFFTHDSTFQGAPVPALINGPNHHQIHHSRARANVNYSLIFTVFDRLFGTYEAPVSRALEEERPMRASLRQR